MLHFICPTFRAAFESGIEMDAETFKKSRLRIAKVKCTLCERDHRFLLADGRFRSEEVAA